jgi:hypothetical protein
MDKNILADYIRINILLIKIIILTNLEIIFLKVPALTL